MEQELLRLGRAHHEALVVAVDLGSDHERHVGVPEVAEEALGEVRQRHVIGVDAEHEVVALAVGLEPGVVVAVLAARAVRPLGPVPALHPATAEVVDAELGAHALDVRVVALVEQPHVELSVVADAPRGLERRAQQIERLGLGHDRGQERHPLPSLRADRHGVAGEHGRAAERRHVQEREPADDPRRRRHDDRRDVDGQVVGAARPVAGQHQPGQEAPYEQQREQHQERAANRLGAVQPAELHAVAAPLRRLGERASKLAIALVVVRAFGQKGAV